MLAGKIRAVSDEYNRLIIQEAIDRDLDGPDYRVYVESRRRLEQIEWLDLHLRFGEVEREYDALCRIVERIEQKYPLPYETFARVEVGGFTLGPKQKIVSAPAVEPA